MATEPYLPIIDIGCWMYDTVQEPQLAEKKIQAARKLFSAFEKVGMAYLRFDGASSKLLHKQVDASFAASQTFFRRPLAEKMSATADNLPPGVTRGYLGTGIESGADMLELKEAFSWSCNWEHRPGSPQHSLEARNVWPRGSSDGDTFMKETYDNLFTFLASFMQTLADALTQAWPASSSPPPLRAICEQGESVSLLRAFHYHGNASPASATTGSCEHTDWGFATLIAQDIASNAALQVRVEDVWHDVPPLPDTLVVNCSDYLSLLTDGRLKSPLHRVLLTPRERISFVFFQYPPFTTPVPALSAAGTERTRGLSLLKDQSAHGKPTPDIAYASFGAFIARKWQQVSRA